MTVFEFHRLRNIFREMSDDLGTVLFPTSGNLDSWATQGVLLLNTLVL
jgi:uracil-DNA glycosylase